VSGKNKEHITYALSKDLEPVSHWLVDNKLSLHLGKTESILFGSKPKLKMNLIWTFLVMEEKSSLQIL